MKVLRVGSKTEKKREDESKKIEERFSSALSKTACTQGRVAAGEIQEVQKESFKTDIYFIFCFSLLFLYRNRQRLQCNVGRAEEGNKRASQRTKERERERERNTGKQQQQQLLLMQQQSSAISGDGGTAVGLKDRAVCVLRSGYLSYTYGEATNGHTHTWEGAYII
jgi:hypothetical protein